MTWEYDVNQNNDKDRVRFIIGDTDNDRQLLQDEEIIAVLQRQNNNLVGAAIELAEHLEAKFVRRAESRSGDIIADFLTVAGKYRELARRLRRKRNKGYWLSTTSARDSDKDNVDAVHTSISLGEFDNNQE
jgi:hypothetical protein